MKVLTELRLRSRLVIGPFLGACLLVYFMYHGVQGDRGLIAYWQLTKQVNQAEKTYLNYRQRRSRMQNRVNLLSPYSLDRDMIEERVRFVLGYSKPDEIVIFKKRTSDGL